MLQLKLRNESSDNKKISVKNTTIEAVINLGILENKVKLLILEITKNSKISRIVNNIIIFIIFHFLTNLL